MTEADIGELVREVHDLQRRVRKLEQRLGEGAEPEARIEAHIEESSPRLPPNLLPVLGRALVAIAGAYILRALTELGVLSPTAGVTAGLAYAFVWLLAAFRHSGAARFQEALWAVTSVVVVAPLLWEASTRLKVFSSSTSAAVLCGYALAGLALSWWRGSRIVPGIVLAATTLAAAALLLETHDLLPFTIALLIMGAGLEFEAARGHTGGARWLTAAAADLAAMLLAWVVSRKAGLPEGYAAVTVQAALAMQFLLFAIYTTSAVVRTLIQRHSFTVPETLQTTAALAIGIGGSAALLASNVGGTLLLGLFALVTGVACYVVSFVVAGLEVKWNFRAWATFGMLLVLSATFLMLSSGYWLPWCACGVACCLVAVAARRPTLSLHGAGYLVLGALASGAAAQPFLQWLAGAGELDRWPALLIIVSAVLAWLAVARSAPGETARWRKQVSSFSLAAVVAWILAGAATRALVLSWPGRGAPADTLGTVVLTLASVGLAWAGRRWRRGELVWLVYGFMVLAAWKMVARDIQHEHSLTLVVSLSFYGGALILLPRILQRKTAG